MDVTDVIVQGLHELLQCFKVIGVYGTSHAVHVIEKRKAKSYASNTNRSLPKE